MSASSGAHVHCFKLLRIGFCETFCAKLYTVFPASSLIFLLVGLVALAFHHHQGPHGLLVLHLVQDSHFLLLDPVVQPCQASQVLRPCLLHQLRLCKGEESGETLVAL